MSASRWTYSSKRMNSPHTIPLTAPFLPALAKGILVRYGHDPFLLSSVLVLLPTRRACRLFADAMLAESGKTSLLLPRIHAIGDVEEDALEMDMPSPATLPPAIAKPRRLLLLMRIIQRQLPEENAAGHYQWALALARLMDETERFGVDIDTLSSSLPTDLPAHRETLLELLSIITRHWPKMLEAEGALNPEARRNLLIDAQIAQWKNAPPAHPVILAGSTGSVPSTARLMECIAGLPQGHLVLSAFEGVSGEPWTTTSHRAERDAICHKLFAPDIRANAMQAEGIHVLEADNEAHEAAMLALLLRESLATAGKTAMLVTPDRALAGRVAAMLRQWEVTVDDSAGQRLADTPAGSLFLLCLDAWLNDFSAETLLALLKHPLCTLGLDNPRAEARKLEMKLMRSRFRRGFESWERFPASSDGAEALARRVANILKPLKDSPKPFAAMLEQHWKCILALSEGSDIATRPEYRTLENAVQQMLASGADHPTASRQEYGALIRGLLELFGYRPAYGTHPRLSILSPMEARLLTADRILVTSLNDGQWPNRSRSDWLGERIRAALGLPGRDEAAEHARQDFIRLWSGRELFLTRARYQEGTPQNPHAWLLRLSLLLSASTNTAAHWSDWAKQLARPAEYAALQDMPPCPPAEKRPKNFSITDIATLMRQPYEYYARRILALKEVDPLSLDIEASLIGNAIHHALEEYTTQYQDGDAASLLEKHLTEILPQTRRTWRLWQPRMNEIAQNFVQFDASERMQLPLVFAEVEGNMELDGFSIRAKADRIALSQENHARISDYKTGAIPTNSEVSSGAKPQLLIELLMLRKGGFTLPADHYRSLHTLTPQYWKLSSTLGSSMRQPIPDIEPASVEENLHRLLSTFAAETQGYPIIQLNSLRIYNPYHHLARIGEIYSAA